jgi:hypothetical protein
VRRPLSQDLQVAVTKSFESGAKASPIPS